MKTGEGGAGGRGRRSKEGGGRGGEEEERDGERRGAEVSIAVEFYLWLRSLKLLGRDSYQLSFGKMDNDNSKSIELKVSSSSAGGEQAGDVLAGAPWVLRVRPGRRQSEIVGYERRRRKWRKGVGRGKETGERSMGERKEWWRRDRGVRGDR